MARLDLSANLSSQPIPIMLRINALTSTPILLSPNATYATILGQLQKEVYARAPEITEGFSFDGLYIEWDRTSGASLTFPPSSALDRDNLVATLGLLKARPGRDVLCLKVRVSTPDVKLQLV
ncbi:predicted protein [Uncinocarpus reesii 1704]|uniref:Uncharacterized protein n=1 Tax=Uncinocarpus reesii (strain UAMH 1704) TaxID=336963 RepID=C4JKT1_UNCRE|nr:uncharacterized protein UREG_00627 [Uncinocarpus reesii 1704]EEP75780.1 predicted protein [Uncinocarpus reesii 1704]